MFSVLAAGQVGNATMFPNGVIFEGVSEDPQYYRGETGAQDSIIPSCDNFLQLSRRYPNNELTEYLVDLRFYRPQDHRKYLEWVESASDAADVAATAMRSSRPALALLQNLHQVQTVRSMHWSMTKKYIIERTEHPVATGGTPITTWLPNNWLATLEYMADVRHTIDHDSLDDNDREEFSYVSDNLDTTMASLKKDVAELQGRMANKDQMVDEFEKRLG